MADVTRWSLPLAALLTAGCACFNPYCGGEVNQRRRCTPPALYRIGWLQELNVTYRASAMNAGSRYVRNLALPNMPRPTVIEPLVLSIDTNS